MLNKTGLLIIYDFQIASGNVIKESKYDVDYDSNCKYRARVQIILSKLCGAGKSDLSDEVEYGTSGPSNQHHIQI